MADSSDQAPRRLGVQPFEREMVRDHLERQQLTFETDSDGDFHLVFAPPREGSPRVDAWITAEGTNGDILVVRARGEALVPKTLWPETMALCNQWNRDRRFPKAYLYVPDEPESLWGQITLEGQFPLAAGCTQPMVDECISTIITTALGFWEWMSERSSLADMPSEPPQSPYDPLG